MHTGILLEFGVLKANADTGRQVKMNKGPFDVKTSHRKIQIQWENKNETNVEQENMMEPNNSLCQRTGETETGGRLWGSGDTWETQQDQIINNEMGNRTHSRQERIIKQETLLILRLRLGYADLTQGQMHTETKHRPDRQGGLTEGNKEITKLNIPDPGRARR